jgi:hypothetical protein
MKWLGYLALCAAFIWFVFFRPFNTNSAELVNSDNTQTEDINDESSFVEDVIDVTDNSDYNISDDTYDNSSDTVANTDVIDNSATDNSSSISDGSINLDSKFLIVVGSFGNKSNADRMLNRVKSDGKDGKMILIRGLHRIVTASTNDRTDARNLRQHFTHIYKEQAFILKQ